MKLRFRNKKTGEIINCFIQEGTNPTLYDFGIEKPKDWEALEEEKPWPTKNDKYFFITWDGNVGNDSWEDFDAERHSLEIGHVFRTREEAEKAVEKLKALKRLRDLGLEFEKWDGEEPHGNYYPLRINARVTPCPKDIRFFDDLDLLFGGEHD